MAEIKAGAGFFGCKSLEQALERANPGDTVLLYPAAEQGASAVLKITKPVRIRALDGLCQVGQPIEIALPGGEIELENIHALRGLFVQSAGAGSQELLLTAQGCSFSPQPSAAPVAFTAGGPRLRAVLRDCSFPARNPAENQSVSLSLLNGAAVELHSPSFPGREAPRIMAGCCSLSVYAADLSVLNPEADVCALQSSGGEAVGKCQLSLFRCKLRGVSGSRAALRLGQNSSGSFEECEFINASGPAVSLYDDSKARFSKCKFVRSGNWALGSFDKSECLVEDSLAQNSRNHGFVSGGQARLTVRQTTVSGIGQSAFKAGGESRLNASGCKGLKADCGAEAEDKAALVAEACHFEACKTNARLRNQSHILFRGVHLGQAAKISIDAQDQAVFRAEGGTVRHGPDGLARKSSQASIELDGVDARDPEMLSGAVKSLENMVGLAGVKREISKLIDLAEAQRKRQSCGAGTQPVSLNLVFSGNPGTGKTSVARIVGKILGSIGLLHSGHLVEADRAVLCGAHIGETAKLTKETFEKALGGVLFIDEAYTLCPQDNPRDFGYEAVETLLKLMEDHRGEISVIVAGYGDKMSQFLSSNPGLESRFTRQIHFEDYGAAELFEVFKRALAEQKIACGPKALERASQALSRLHQTKTGNFGNARAARTLIEQALEKQAGRLRRDPEADPFEIAAEDIPEFGQTEHLDAAGAVAELDRLVGISKAKAEIKKIHAAANMQNRRREQGLPWTPTSMHLVFQGSPGTGKTTLARLVGKIYASLGLLSKGHLVEAQRADFVANVMGGSAIKTQKKIEEAQGGILFLDEAYALIQGPSDQFGQESLDTLLKAMEDKRGSFALICAGYQGKMREFLEANPGLQSRFNRFVLFEDYTCEDLGEVFLRFCAEGGYRLDDAAFGSLEPGFAALKDAAAERFGNARDARSVFEKALDAHALRLADDPAGELDLLCAPDLEAAFRERIADYLR